MCSSSSGRQVRGRAFQSQEKVYKSIEAPNNMTYLGNCKSLGMTAAYGVSWGVVEDEAGWMVLPEPYFAYSEKEIMKIFFEYNKAMIRFKLLKANFELSRRWY